jgi:hypothetical protein
MGVSTDAYLFFGFDFCNPEEEGETLIWEDLGYGWEDEWLKELFGDEPLKCQIDIHCNSEYPIYFVHVKGRIHRAFRGSPTVIENLDVSEEDIENLKEFCKVTGIEYQEPKWILASYWG